MLRESEVATHHHLYRAPMLFVAVFYALLAAWTLVCLALLGPKLERWAAVNLLQLFMIAFILFYTWYFSVAISYKIEVEDDGGVQLTSLRRVVRTSARDIPLVEGPHFSIGLIRFRLEREKAYLFCLVKDESLKRVLSMMRAANPQIRFKGLTIV